MKITEMAKQLKLRIEFEPFRDEEVGGAYTSDLLSDVMANAQEGQVLITIQAHKNTVAVASLIGSSGIIICNNRPLADDMVAAARDEGIPILVSAESQFAISGKLYRLLGGE
jgi:phosphohistidine swiveling domain-containing protein